MSREAYQKAHRFDISPMSLVGMELLRSELGQIHQEFSFVKGLGFYGSRTKGRAREFNPNIPDQLGSDYDVCVFYDGSILNANASATGDLPNDQSQFEVEIQGRIINFVTTKMKTIKQGKGSTVIIDISKEATDESLNDFYEGVRTNTNPFSFKTRKLLARFFLGVGSGIYENRKYVLDAFSKQPNGDELFNILMQRLGAFERTRDDESDHPNKNAVPYEGYPKTIQEARKFFLTR